MRAPRINPAAAAAAFLLLAASPRIVEISPEKPRRAIQSNPNPQCGSKRSLASSNAVQASATVTTGGRWLLSLVAIVHHTNDQFFFLV
jgi:hypothetical protein